MTTNKIAREHPSGRHLTTALALFLLLVTFHNPTATAQPSITDRIVAGLRWASGQKLESRGVTGFATGVTGNDQSNLMTTADHALFVLSVTMFQFTHNSIEFSDEFYVAVNFLTAAQSPSRDFYGWFDPASGSWLNSGSFYSWDAYAVMGLSISAFFQRDFRPERTENWDRMIDLAEATLLAWHDRAQQQDGGWLISGLDGTAKKRLAENGLVLAALSYIAAYDARWRSATLASAFAERAQKTAQWLLSNLELNNHTWGYGGFYDSDPKSEQWVDSNSLAMFGINSYYRVISLAVPNPSPSLNSARDDMNTWVEGFASKLLNDHFGPSQLRNLNGTIDYPKNTRTAALLAQALGDIWINTGNERYYNMTAGIFSWLTGNNELATDLQGSRNRNGTLGGFFEGIASPSLLNNNSSLHTTLLALYAMSRLALIDIAEFGGGGIFVALVAIGCFVALMMRRNRRAR